MRFDDEHSDFWPPNCPNPGCEQASSARRGGFFRHGHYRTQVHGRRIPRFLCRSCRRTMSSQTFDETYRLRMPELEDAILDEISRGSSLRRVAEVLRINRKTVSRRLRRARIAAEAAASLATVAAVAEARPSSMTRPTAATLPAKAGASPSQALAGKAKRSSSLPRRKRSGRQVV